LRNTIENGVPKTGMKVFKKHLTNAEIKDLLACALSLWR